MDLIQEKMAVRIEKEFIAYEEALACRPKKMSGPTVVSDYRARKSVYKCVQEGLLEGTDPSIAAALMLYQGNLLELIGNFLQREDPAHGREQAYEAMVSASGTILKEIRNAI